MINSPLIVTPEAWQNETDMIGSGKRSRKMRRTGVGVPVHGQLFGNDSVYPTIPNADG